MSELSTIQFPDFVALAGKIWLSGAEKINPVMRNSGIVDVMPMSENTGNTRSFSDIDTNEFLSYKGEGDQAARAKVQQGYSKNMTAFRVAENISITYEMRTQNKYPEVVSRLTSAGEKGPKTIELDLTHRITFATSTSYTDRDGRTIDTTCGDTYALAYTAHTLKGSSTTFRNILANNPRLSKGALESMERMIIENTYSQLGEKKTLSYDILFTTDDPNTVNTAREYLQSTADIEGANSGVVNVYKSKYTHVILPYIATDANGNVDTTKRYYWGLASSQKKPIKFGIWEEPHMMAPAANQNSEDVQTDDWEFRVRAGYGICTPNPLGICLSQGNGNA